MGIKQFLKRLQSASVVDGAAHTQKDDVESNGARLFGESCKGLCAVPLRLTSSFQGNKACASLPISPLQPGETAATTISI
jgi:hypothetical protein